MAKKGTKEEGTLRTPLGRLQYMALFKAKMYHNDDGDEDPKFEGTLLLPKSGPDKADLTELKAAVTATAKAAFGGKIPKKFRDPIKDGDQEDWPGFAGNWYIRMSTKFPINICDLEGEDIFDSSQIKNGDWIIAVVKPYAYDYKGKGVSFGMRNLLFIREDEALLAGTPAADDFDDLIEAAPKDDAFDAEDDEGLL